LQNANGGIVLLAPAIYSLTSSIIINKNGTQLVGSGSSREQVYFPAVPTPLAHITNGAVLRIDKSGIDGIDVVGKLFGVKIENLAIDFNVGSTGHGINCIAESGGLGLSEFEFHNIFVNNHDGSHYALRMETAAMGIVDLFTSFGGSLLELTLQSTSAKYGVDFHCGNIVFTQLTGWITKNVTGHIIYLHRINGTGILNLYQFNRLFAINDASVILQTYNNGIRLENVMNSQFNMMDIELWYNGAADVVHLAGTYTCTFLNPYVMYSTGGGWMAWSDTSEILVTGGMVDVTVADYSPKNGWYGVSIHSVNAVTAAYLDKCYLWSGTAWLPTYNCGTATITASTSVTFNHGLAGTPTHVECGFKTLGYGTWRWSATSTQITITVQNSGTYTFSWCAEYRP
jgi:hypothetical protein